MTEALAHSMIENLFFFLSAFTAEAEIKNDLNTEGAIKLLIISMLCD